MTTDSKQPNGMPWVTFNLSAEETVAAIKAQRELIAERSQPYGYYYNHIFVGDYNDRELLFRLNQWLDYLTEIEMQKLRTAQQELNAEVSVMESGIDSLTQLAAE